MTILTNFEMRPNKLDSLVFFLLLTVVIDVTSVYMNSVPSQSSNVKKSRKQGASPRIPLRISGGGGNGTVSLQHERRGHVSITRVSSMGLLNPYFHDEDLGFSLFLERR